MSAINSNHNSNKHTETKGGSIAGVLFLIVILISGIALYLKFVKSKKNSTSTVNSNDARPSPDSESSPTDTSGDDEPEILTGTKEEEIMGRFSNFEANDE